MPIDEYNRQLLPESKSTQMGNPAWMICKYAMLWPCCSLFSFKALLYFRHLCYFAEIISQRFYFISQRFYFLSGRFIIALLFSVRALYHSAFIQIFLSAGMRFIIALSLNFFLSASKCLFFILNTSQRLFCVISMEQCPIFYFKICISFYFNFLM